MKGIKLDNAVRDCIFLILTRGGILVIVFPGTAAALSRWCVERLRVLIRCLVMRLITLWGWHLGNVKTAEGLHFLNSLEGLHLSYC